MKDFLIDLQTGVHTVELSQTLTKKQFTAILDCCCTKGRLIHVKEKKECYVLQDQSMPGITVTLYPIRSHNVYRVSIKIEPCRVLDSDDPTELYRYSKESYRKLQKVCNPYLEGLQIPGGIDAMAISRCDLTCNLFFTHQDYVEAYLRILKKSHLIPDYKVVQFSKHERKAKNPKRANEHSYCIRCSRAVFLCYDKIDQLDMIGRYTEKLDGCFVLRMEAQLKREGLKRRLGKEAMQDNASILKAGTAQAAGVIAYYLEKMFPCDVPHFRYEDTVSAIKTVKKEAMREQMLFLLRKTSDGSGLDTAIAKCQKAYQSVGQKQIKRIWEKFDLLGVNPIPLTNSSPFCCLRSLRSLLEIEKNST